MSRLIRRRILTSLIPGFLTASAQGTDRNSAHPLSPEPRASDRIPDVKLVNHRGQSVRLYSDLIANRPVLINMMYVNCEGTCPGTSALLSSLWPDLDQMIGPELRILSITLDPERDGAKELAAYSEPLRPRAADSFGSDWQFLTGSIQDIESVRKALGFSDPDPVIDGDRSQHSAIITFGNDRLNRWATMPVEMSRKQLQKSIVRILRGTAVGGVK